MTVKITNAVVQSGGATTVSAQLVVASGLSYNAKLEAFSTLVGHAAASLELPHDGPMAAEILYRLADERAGVAPLPPPEPAAEIAAAEAAPRRAPRWAAVMFWIGLVLLVAAAFLVQSGA